MANTDWLCEDLCCGARNPAAAVVCVACGYPKGALPVSDWTGRVTRGLERQASFAGGLVGGGERAAAPAEELELTRDLSDVILDCTCRGCGVPSDRCRCEVIELEPEWLEGRGPSAHGAG